MAVAERAELDNRSMETEESVRIYVRYWKGARLFFRWFAARALRFSGKERGRALDVATGPGFLLVALARRAPDWDITGVDISPVMLAEAERRLQREGLSDRVRVAEGSALDLSFEDGSFDLVTMTNALHNVGNLPALLAEVERVLAPGGVFVSQSYARDAIWPVRVAARMHSSILGLTGTSLEGMGAVLRSSFVRREIEREVSRHETLSGDVRKRFGSLLLVQLRKRTAV